MTYANDGGPAFPQMRIWNAERAEYEDTQQFPGMSLRDWFAGQAMAGIAARISVDPTAGAKVAYAIADAMLAGRSKPTA